MLLILQHVRYELGTDLNVRNKSGETCKCSCNNYRVCCSIWQGTGGGSMGSVEGKWSVEYTPAIDDTKIHSLEEWDNDQSIDTLIYHRRGAAGLWTALAALAVALAVAAVYGYSVISNHNAKLEWVTGRVSSLGALRARTKKLETLLGDLKARQASLETQVQKVGTDWKSGLNLVQLRAADLVANARQREGNDLNQRAAALNSQVAQIVSRQHSEQALIAQLQRELAYTRQDLASTKTRYSRDLAAIQQQQVSSKQEIDSLSDVLSVDQIEFNAERNRDEEIVKGVSLHLTGTDLAHQRFRGWIWIAGSRRRIWVRNHPAELPVAFYPKPDGDVYELVVTKVGPEDVSGYLLVPSDTNVHEQDMASNRKSLTRSDQGTF